MARHEAQIAHTVAHSKERKFVVVTDGLTTVGMERLFGARIGGGVYFGQASAYVGLGHLTLGGDPDNGFFQLVANYPVRCGLLSGGSRMLGGW